MSSTDCLRCRNVVRMKNPYPSLEERLGWLDRFEEMMVANRQVFIDSLESDFGSHPAFVTELVGNGCDRGAHTLFST